MSKYDPEKVVKAIRRRTRRKYSAEEKIRIVLEELRGEESIAELCRREGLHQGAGITCLRYWMITLVTSLPGN